MCEGETPHIPSLYVHHTPFIQKGQGGKMMLTATSVLSIIAILMSGAAIGIQVRDWKRMKKSSR